MEVKFKKTSCLARKLTGAAPDSASYDLYSCESKKKLVLEFVK